MPPRFSIVIPAHNAARFLPDALASLAAQSCADWEALVVDDGSTDETLAVARGVADARVRVHTQPNRGVSAARNWGLAEATGEYIVFLDADDILLPGALERYAGALDADASLSAVYGEGEIVDEEGQLLVEAAPPVWNARPSGDVLVPLLRRNFILSGGGLCARTLRAREAGPFREDLRLHEDWEHWCRLARTGPFRYLGVAPVFRYRRTGEGVVGSIGADTAIAMVNVAAVFEHPGLRSRLSPGKIATLRQQSEASVFSFAATQHLKRGAWHEARRMLAQSLRRQPAQAREWLLLGCACLGWLPGPVRARLK
jgi:hypothetical protein